MLYFIIFIIIIVIIFYYFEIKKDNFTNYPYNPQIKTPQSNYLEISKKLKDQDKYKYEISVALSPIPIIQCDKLKTKSSCNNNGCNWFGKYCSAINPTYL
jgi:hypothetical protein